MPQRVLDNLRSRLGVAGFVALSAGLGPPKRFPPRVFVPVEVGGVDVPAPAVVVVPPNKPPPVEPPALVLLLGTEPKMPPPTVVGFRNPKGPPVFPVFVPAVLPNRPPVVVVEVPVFEPVFPKSEPPPVGAPDGVVVVAGFSG